MVEKHNWEPQNGVFGMRRFRIPWCIAITLMPAISYGQQQTASGNSVEFEKLSKLVGRWEGTTDGGETDAVVTYKFTGRNTSIVETLFPGTPMEMITVYHDDADGELVAKHFCIAMNQPQLQLSRSSDNELFFEHSRDDPNVDEATELHGHDLAIRIEDDATLQLEWFNRKNGVSAGSRRYDFTKTEQE